MKIRVGLITLFFLIGQQISYACKECKRNQPEILKDVVHGDGPTGTLDYIITWFAIITVVITLYLSIKYMINPKESNPNHIKNSILNL